MNSVKLSGCVLFDKKNNLLLIHRNKNGKVQWETPGGKVEKDESDEAGAIRELKEELGIQVNLISKIGEGDFSEGKNLFHYVWFRAAPSDQDGSINLETGFDDYQYFSLDDLREMKPLISAGTNKLLELYWAGKLNVFA